MGQQTRSPGWPENTWMWWASKHHSGVQYGETLYLQPWQGGRGHCHIQLHPLQFTFGTSPCSNFREGLLRAVYRGLPGWNLELDLHFIQSKAKWRRNQLLAAIPELINTSRQSDYNNELLQGTQTKYTIYEALCELCHLAQLPTFYSPITEKSLPVNWFPNPGNGILEPGLCINATIDKNIY